MSDCRHFLPFYNLAFRDAFMNFKENELCVVTDYAEGGDMYEVIKEYQSRRTFVPEPLVWDYLEQITTGGDNCKMTLILRSESSA